MVSLRSFAFELGFALAISLALLVPTSLAAEASNGKCYSVFSSSEAAISGVDDIVYVEIDVREKTPVKDVIYTLTWAENCVEAPKITDTTFSEYFLVDDTTKCTWKVSVNSLLIGLPDYPNVQKKLETQVTFQDFTGIDYTTCTVTLTHNILDENTQKPKPDLQTYVLEIEEIFMSKYPISGFKTKVHDLDGESPNNKFTANTDPNCPLEATKPSYTSGAEAVSVSYQLKESLDFETEDQFQCEVIFQDLGTDPLTTTANINITVTDVPDEPPEFTEDYYYAEVTSVLASDEPLPVKPSIISAIDGDTSLDQPITYTMTDVQLDVEGTTYFNMNQKTGEVTLVQDLDETFLLNERVLFFVTAEDTSGAQCKVVLEVILPWHNLICGGLHFEQAQYLAEIFYQSDGQVLRVHAISSTHEEKEYSLSEDSVYFDIDSSTGWITVKKDSTPEIGLYHLEAVATIKVAPSEQATAQVNINVVSPTEEVLLIENGVIRSLVEEGEDEQDVSTFKISQPAEIVCITGASPLHMEDRFELEKQDNKNWKLRKTGVLDYEETQEITLVVEAFHEAVVCPQANDNIPSDLKRNQALAIISVSNKNDEKPTFSSEHLEVAYPTNEGLQRAVGPVVTVQAEDKDSTQMKYSITGTDAAKFAVDEETGEVYVLKSLNCDPECKFEVTASDGDNDAQLDVKVIPLGMEHVFTLLMNGTTVSEVDAQLTQLSEDVGVQISKLYVSPMQPTVRQRVRLAPEAQVNLQVHVYGIQEGSLMTLDDLNSALDQSSTSLEAEEFLEAVVFEAPVQDNTGLTVAVAILGTLLGLVLIVGIGFIIYKKKKPVSTHNKVPSPSPINTLGNAYQNHAYEKEGHMTQGSLGHKTNGSLNGFTSVQVHSTHDGNSPPMHRSSLAKPSDSIQLRSIDSQQQKQGGLRRTNPSTPEYYGSSTPAPPPSFTRTTASSSTPEPSSSFSSSPIYAEINKPKSTASAFTSSSSSSRPEKNVPLSDFSTSSKDKKPAVPNSHYEEVGNTKFSSLKASPPPRRSNNHNADDDDDEDVNEGVAYPGGKNARFEDEPDEKKVAFKVMVDTKEIEAENMGPAQKKAEVEKLMEANRKKLQEEGDEEESAKL